MNLRRVVNALEACAPSRWAEKWDNVGLLVEPSSGPHHRVERIMLTNDLTEAVLDEGIEKKANMIVSYHPLIFNPFKRLCGGGQDESDWKQRLIVRCVEHRIAVYSPHSAWDAAPAGVNNWLADAFDNCDVKPIIIGNEGAINAYSTLFVRAFKCLELRPVTKDEYDEMINIIYTSEALEPYLITQGTRGASESNLRVVCPTEYANYIVEKLLSHNPGFDQFLDISMVHSQMCGMGRICDLRVPLSLEEVLGVIKRYLNLTHVQLAIGRGVSDTNRRFIRRVALCAGSGASVLREAKCCDVHWTGEMSHHEVLDTVSKGITVVLCGHSNTERGFLACFAPKLREMLHGNVEVFVSAMDADPLVVT